VSVITSRARLQLLAEVLGDSENMSCEYLWRNSWPVLSALRAEMTADFEREKAKCLNTLSKWL
jgi:hypothetical protein